MIFFLEKLEHVGLQYASHGEALISGSCGGPEIQGVEDGSEWDAFGFRVMIIHS